MTDTLRFLANYRGKDIYTTDDGIYHFRSGTDREMLNYETISMCEYAIDEEIFERKHPEMFASSTATLAALNQKHRGICAQAQKIRNAINDPSDNVMPQFARSNTQDKLHAYALATWKCYLEELDAFRKAMMVA